MSASDEELQERVEQGHALDADNLDEKAYTEVFRVLKKDPGYELSARFAERVAASVVTQKASMDFRDYVWFGAGILLLMLAFIGTVLFTGLNFDLSSMSVDLGFLSEALTTYKGLAIFGVAFIMFLNWLDKRLVRSKQFSD